MPVPCFSSFAAISVLLISATQTIAADNTLYDAPPPDDAAYLRWIESGDAPEILGVRGLGPDGAVFHPVSAAATDGAEAGRFYTAARDASGAVQVLAEPERQDRSKVHLTLLNMGEAPAQLVVDGQDLMVIGATPVNAAASRAVNPVNVTLQLITDNGTVLGHFDLALRRGQDLTFVARADKAELVENRFGPTIGN